MPGLELKKKKTFLGRLSANGYSYITSYFSGTPLRRYLRCTYYKKLNCKARAVQDCGTSQILSTGQHNHFPNEQEDNVLEFLTELRRSITLNNTLKEVYESVAGRDVDILSVWTYKAESSEPISYKYGVQIDKWICVCDVSIVAEDLIQNIKRRPNMPRYIVDGFVFHVNIMKGNPPMIYLRCLEYKRLGCHARAVIPYDGSIHDIKLNKPHNHPPDFSAEEKIIFMRELKEVMLKNPTVPSRTVYQTLAELYPNAARETSFESIRNKMNRWKRQQETLVQTQETEEKEQLDQPKTEEEPQE